MYVIERIIYMCVCWSITSACVTFTQHKESGRLAHKHSCAVPECLMVHTSDTVQLPICTIVTVSYVTYSEKTKKDNRRRHPGLFI